jgi:hypothetical protein
VVLHPDATENIIALETHVFPNSPENAVRFAASRKKETDGLLQSNVFHVMKRADAIACGNRIYKNRFVDAVKNANSPRAVGKFPLSYVVLMTKKQKTCLPRLRQCRRTQSE